MPSCINGSCGLGPSECQCCSEAAERQRTHQRNPPTPKGREWNDKLYRKLVSSIFKAQDRPQVTRLLVTDMTDSELTLVEVLGIADDQTTEQVIAEFLVKPKKRPKTLRYRSERGWPE